MDEYRPPAAVQLQGQIPMNLHEEYPVNTTSASNVQRGGAFKHACRKQHSEQGDHVVSEMRMCAAEYRLFSGFLMVDCFSRFGPSWVVFEA